jgi:iron complex outermembrane receptor protein
MPAKVARLPSAFAPILILLSGVLAPFGLRADGLAADELLDLSLEQLMQLEVRVASRIPTNSMNAASSVYVVPEAAWQSRGARNVSDVLATIPGVAIVPSLAGADAFAIRGYTRSTSLLGVLLSWDGVPLNDLFRGAPTLNLPGLNLGAIDEIQVIEGPGSALYGSDAFHGVVALTPFDSETRRREIYADARSNGFYTAGARVSSALGESAHASLALAADGQSDQELAFGYTDPTTGAPLAGERANRYGAESISLQLRGKASGNVSWHSGVLIHHYDGQEFQGFGTRLAGTRDVGGVDSDLYLVDGGVKRELPNDAALELSVYAWQTDSVLTAGRSTFDFESANAQHRYGAHLTYESGPTKLNTEWAFVLGIEDLAVEDARTRTFDLNGAPLLDTVNPAEGASRRIYSATFEANSYWSAERWRLVYGARVDQYSDFGNEVSPRLGIIWHPQDHNAVKLLYGNAFRAPSANDMRGTPGLIAANDALQPEVIDTLELVLMHQAEHWVSQLTLFHSRWHDGIVSVANVGGAEPFVFTNLEENNARGVTWSFKWQRDPWLLNLGVSSVRSENETLGDSYDAFPRYVVDGEVGYRHPRWNTRFSLVQHWQIETDDVFPPSAGIPATSLADYRRTDLAAIQRLNARLELTLFVRNVFDRENVLPSGAGSRGGIPDEPRTFSAQVRYIF